MSGKELKIGKARNISSGFLMSLDLKTPKREKMVAAMYSRRGGCIYDDASIGDGVRDAV